MLSMIEAEVLRMLLAGDHPTLLVLRKQLAAAEVVDRQFTGMGFFTYFQVPAPWPRLNGNPSFVIGDVYATLSGLEHPAGFLLFIRDGAIDNLECFIVDAQWPGNPTLVRAFYMHPREVGTALLVETPVRDLDWVLANQ